MSRYIDADALTKKLGSLMKRYAAQGRTEVAQDYNWVCTVLDAAPTADVEPVVHGHYVIDDDGDASCSVCHEEYLNHTQNYCPNCGAKMDGERRLDKQ